MSETKRQRVARLVQDMRAANEEPQLPTKSAPLEDGEVNNYEPELSGARGPDTGDPRNGQHTNLQVGNWETLREGDGYGNGEWYKKQHPNGMYIKGLGVENGGGDAMISLMNHPHGGYTIHPNSSGDHTLAGFDETSVIKDPEVLIHDDFRTPPNRGTMSPADLERRLAPLRDALSPEDFARISDMMRRRLRSGDPSSQDDE